MLDRSEALCAGTQLTWEGNYFKNVYLHCNWGLFAL